jgi:hypothetical protein
VARLPPLTELIRQVQAVNGVISVDAQMTWEIDDDTAMATWPVA